MSKIEFAKRIKILVDREIQLTRREQSSAKETAKYKARVAQLELKIYEKFRDLQNLQKEVEKLRCQNAELKKLLQESERRIDGVKRCAVERQQERHRHSIVLGAQREEMLKAATKLRVLKECTETFINTDVLPERIQGAVVCEKENSSQWVPIQIVPEHYKRQTVENMIWSQSRISSAYNDEWHNLLMKGNSG